MKSQNVYVPIDSSLVHRDDDDSAPEEDVTTAGVRDYIDDDLDDDPEQNHNRTKARKYGGSEDNKEDYVNLPFRPTLKMVVINSSGNYLIGTDLQRLKSEVPFSEEPWPTITLSTFDVIVPMIPTGPARTSPPVWRTHFPAIKSSLNHGKQTRNVSREALNFTTERASKFDADILDRFIYPDDYVLTTLPSDVELEDTGIPTFVSRTTATMGIRPTITWFNRPKNNNKMRVVVKFTNSTHKTIPSRTITMPKKRFSVQFSTDSTDKVSDPPRAVLRQRSPRWLCYECGLNETELSTRLCNKVFESPDGRYRGLRRFIQKSCPGDTTHMYHGGCFTRYLDVGELYGERGCREWPPVKGKSFASKRYTRLEQILKRVSNGCINSPYAILTPFSRAVHLYTRFHVCVCTGKFCNASSRFTLDWPLVLVSLVWFTITRKETWVLL